MKDESKISIEDLEKLEEVKLEIGNDAISANEGICPKCNERMTKYVDNKNLFEGALTFHIIKFKCLKCRKEYLDLEEAQKYDLFLKLEKIGKDKVVDLIAEKKVKRVYA